MGLLIEDIYFLNDLESCSRVPRAAAECLYTYVHTNASDPFYWVPFSFRSTKYIERASFSLAGAQCIFAQTSLYQNLAPKSFFFPNDT